MQGSNPWYYLLAFLVHYASFPVRGLRWRVIAANAHLDSAPNSHLPSAMACARFILLGWFISTISWFRLGDPYRAYTFSQAAGASFPRTFGTIIAERLIDVVTVFLLLLVGAALLVIAGDLRPSPVFLGVAFLMVVGAGLLLLLMKHLGVRLARLLPKRLADAYHRLYEGTMGSFRRLPLIGLLSIIAWLLEVGRLWLVLQALDLSPHASLVLFVAVASALLSTAPITPGGLGIVELGASGLLMLDLPRAAAVSAILLDRSISYLSIIVVGGGLFLFTQLRKRPARRSPSPLLRGEDSL